MESTPPRQQFREQGLTLSLNLNLGKKLAIFCLAIFLSAFSAIVLQRYWSDSEIWGVRQAQMCASFWDNYACAWKPLFNLTISSVLKFVSTYSIVDVMWAARFAMLTVWILTFIAALSLGMNPALLVGFSASSLFLIESSTVRADFFALPLLIYHFHLLRNSASSGSSPGPTQKQVVLIVLSALAACLMTPKAAIPLVCFLPFTWHFFYFHRLGLNWIWIAGATIVGLMLLDWRETFFFFFRLFNAKDYGSTYFASDRFYFLIRTFKENPHLAILLIGLPLWYLSRIYFEKQKRPITGKTISREAISAGLLLSAVALYPDRLPFFISMMVFLFLFVASFELQGHRKIGIAVSVLVATVGLATGARWALVAIDLNNEGQVQIAHAVNETRLAHPKIRIFDGIGLASMRKAPDIFFGPGQHALNLELVKRLPDEKFDVILVTNKVRIVQIHFISDLIANYTEVGPDIFVRKDSKIDTRNLRRVVGQMSYQFGFEPLARRQLELFTLRPPVLNR